MYTPSDLPSAGLRGYIFSYFPVLPDKGRFIRPMGLFYCKTCPGLISGNFVPFCIQCHPLFFGDGDTHHAGDNIDHAQHSHTAEHNKRRRMACHSQDGRKKLQSPLCTGIVQNDLQFGIQRSIYMLAGVRSAMHFSRKWASASIAM